MSSTEKTVFGKYMEEYLQSTKAAHTHAGKLIAFSELMKSIFGVTSFEIVQNVEQYVRTGGVMVLKGRMDLQLGQTILEFKIDLSRELETGIEEIQRYASILRENKQKVAECIITDGIQFKVYTVREKAIPVREINFQEKTPEQAIMFLDTFLFSERKVPTAEDLNMRFGPGSAIYEEVVGELSVLFKAIKDPVKFELWAKNMQLVYGSTPPDEAFVSHTYLMILVKLLLAKRLTKDTNLPAREALTGKLLSSQGINIIEDDFFSWVLNPLFWSEVKVLLQTITEAFDSYDLSSVDEDIFKEIYQEIVKRADRHKLGEYYTPEWLAELTLNEAASKIDPNNERGLYSILDPACGSGTFLTNAISMLKKKGYSLTQILDNVYGLDLNPLAVAIARANYLLALGKLIETKKGTVFIPVFMADSIKLPHTRKELHHGYSILAIDVDDKVQLGLPLELALDDNRLRSLLAIFTDVLTEYKAGKLTANQVTRTFETLYHGDKKEVDVLRDTLSTIIKLIDDNKDSVWVFMLRNIYAPLRMMKRKFELVIGNPPWISFKFIENPFYQDFVKKTAFKYLLLKRRQTDLFTHMDTSTVFYCVTADVYLADLGVLAFVMPRSILTGAKQHEAFKKQRKPQMRIIKILDVEKVNPLFKVDACSVIAQKGQATCYPVETVTVNATLPEKNLRLNKAMKFMTFSETTYTPLKREKRISPYYDKVLSGANIYPRTLWFIKFLSGTFGLNPEAPSVESLVLPDAKEPWKKVIMKNEVESDFIFLTVTGKTLLPFKTQFQPVLLPLRKDALKFTILTSQELRQDGKLKMANWLDGAQEIWTSKGTKTALKTFPRVMDYVNYHNKLALQKQNLRYYVIQTASGSNIAAAVVDTLKIPKLEVGKVEITPQGFIADYTTFWYGTNDIQEAYFLASILNSATIDQVIKKRQPKGKFGPRHICRLPFEQNIPQFDPKNELHKQIALAGIEASKEAIKVKKTSRTKTKTAIPSMEKIDKLVLELLNDKKAN
jgi:hypothetical protein